MQKLIFSFLFLSLMIVTSVNAQTVVDIVVNSPDHNTLETAVIAAELADDLSGAGPFTVFAPTDAAFAAIDPATLDALLADPTGDLATILSHHVVFGVADSSNITDGLAVGNLIAQNLAFSTSTGSLTVNGATITVTDLRASNGVVHVIDAVMLPMMVPTRINGTIMDVVSTSPVHTTLNTLLETAGLDAALSGTGPFTLFAPTDAAIAALPQATVDALLADPTGALTDVLLFHAVNGVASTDNITDGLVIGSLSGKNLSFTATANGVSVEQSNISVFDIYTNNGVVHVIDAVLVP